ncbi:hypothetical protein K491DRAFT_758441 [Lophiostoma macrostomum CBS 122681]|uniref:NACHT domain-containing protein n=1 Tax=Lophiostoma macrostomum CBS 122681 TaxID=1314788 RepID=A0A6A6T639_9PLEO|nr:hypothetical protein K491DRAFT_758441 [Lophiostoma macrostomum CBS 122681]
MAEISFLGLRLTSQNDTVRKKNQFPRHNREHASRYGTRAYLSSCQRQVRPHGIADALFASSFELFVSSLRLDDKQWMRDEKQWSTLKRHAVPAKLFQELARSCERHKHESRLLACCEKFRAFSDAVVPYFEVVTIFVSVEPEWFAAVWSAMRLIFKLGQNVVTLFEKFVDLLDRLSYSMPQFQRHFDTFRERPSNVQIPQAVTLLAYMYADILQILHEGIQMLSRITTGIGSNKLSRMISRTTTVFKPITRRFKEAEERIKIHQKLLLNEFQVIRDENFTQHLSEFQTFSDTIQEDLQGDRIKQYLDDVQAFVVSVRKSEGQHEEHQRSGIASKLDEVYAWIGPSNYRDLYERSCRAKLENTSTWFLERSDYHQLRDSPFRIPQSDSDTDVSTGTATVPVHWKSRVMVLQGKPGYGKTSLATIIDDVKKTISANEHLGRVGTSMCFHHFSRLDATTRSDSAAYRALVLQLVQSHCLESRAIDVLSIFHEEKARNQAQASMDDLEEVLHILLWQFPTFVVVDGIEEAYDGAAFLQRFCLKLQDVDTKGIFLSRPTVNIPSLWLGRSMATSCVVKLNADDNRKDFEWFFNVELRQMVSNGLFKQRQSVVCSPEPTTADGGLGEREPFGRPRRALRRYPNPVSRRIRRQSRDGALAIVPGERTSDANYLCDWLDCVPKVTEGLVEVYHDRLHFLHDSLREYLESERSLAFPRFSLSDKGPVHAYLATQCISYLAHDVPKLLMDIMRERRVSLLEGRSWDSIGHRIRNRGLVVVRCHCQERSSTSLGLSENASSRSTSPRLQPSSLDSESVDHSPHDDRGVSLQDSNRSSSYTEGRDQVFTRYPFLPYAALSCFEHLRQSIETQERAKLKLAARQLQALDPGYDPKQDITDQIRKTATWLEVLSQFFLQSEPRAVWVEVCYHFRYAPDLSRLVPTLKDLEKYAGLDSQDDREIRWIGLGLHQLKEALAQLQTDHKETLMQHPGQIWGSRITSATDSTYWPVHRIVLEGESGRSQPSSSIGVRIKEGFGARLTQPRSTLGVVQPGWR